MTKFIRLIAAIAMIFTVGTVTSVMAQSDKGYITGHITDTSGAVLQGAEVEMQPGGATVATNAQGAYNVTSLTPGTYTITVTYVGFALFTKVVTISAGQATTLDVRMELSSQNDQILVTSDRGSGEAEAVNRERTADNILQVLPNEVFTSLPNANVADAVGRLPSVTLERDEGEGKYIQVRSLEPRLTNATIDGINVPSPEPGVRQIKFDAMPADLVESVEVNKTLQANMDGDGIGGSVNLVTKTATERPTISVAGFGGTTPIITHRALTQVMGTVGERFGENKQWGVLFGTSYDWNGRGINDIEPTPDVATNNTTQAQQRWFDEQDMREYQYKRSRWGFTGTLDRSLGEGSDIYAKFLYSDFHDFGDKWTYQLFDNTQGITTYNGNGGNPVFKVSNRVPVFTIASFLLGGKHVFSTSWLSWEVAVSRSQMLHSGGDEGAKFETNDTFNSLYPNGSTCQFSPQLTTKFYVPGWTQNCFTEAYAPTNYDMTSINTSVGKSPQLNLLAAAAYAKQYHLWSHLSTIEVGGKFRNEHKFDNSYTPTYSPNDSVPLTPFVSKFKDPGYYKGNYAFGPGTNWGELLGYLNQNLSSFTLDPSSVGVNSGNFDLVEQVSAGYVMDTIDFNKVRIVAGLRIEGTSLFTSTPAFSDCPSSPQGCTPPINPVTGYIGNLNKNGSYINYLPSVAAKIDLGHDTNLRLVYSRALSRPDPQDIAQAYTVAIDGGQPYSESLGNPNLKAETANNYDVLVEHYLKPFGMIQAGYFYKQLYSPIVTTTILKTDYSPDPSNPLQYPVGNWQITQPVNAGSGWLSGIEVGYLQHFTSLPGFLNGLGLSANYSHTSSQARGIPGRSDSPALLRQSPNIFNISPTYDKHRLSIRAGFTYNQASIYAYQYQDGTPGGLYGPLGDQYFFTHFQIDVQGSYYIGRGLTFMAYGLNLNNEVFGFYNGQKQYFVQREYYEPTLGLGLRWSPTHEK